MMFNKIRLSYLEDMINDPEVMEAINNPLSEWIVDPSIDGELDPSRVRATYSEANDWRFSGGMSYIQGSLEDGEFVVSLTANSPVTSSIHMNADHKYYYNTRYDHMLWIEKDDPGDIFNDQQLVETILVGLSNKLASGEYFSDNLKLSELLGNSNE